MTLSTRIAPHLPYLRRFLVLLPAPRLPATLMLRLPLKP